MRTSELPVSVVQIKCCGLMNVGRLGLVLCKWAVLGFNITHKNVGSPHMVWWCLNFVTRKIHWDVKSSGLHIMFICQESGFLCYVQWCSCWKHTSRTFPIKWSTMAWAPSVFLLLYVPAPALRVIFSPEAPVDKLWLWALESCLQGGIEQGNEGRQTPEQSCTERLRGLS